MRNVPHNKQRIDWLIDFYLVKSTYMYNNKQQFHKYKKTMIIFSMKFEYLKYSFEN